MIDKSLTRDLLQACINEYSGEYGEQKKVFDRVEPFKIEHVEGHFGELNRMPNTLFIVFRGSDGAGDWIDNFKFWKSRFPKKKQMWNNKIKLHSGFLEQYLEVKEIIRDKAYDYKEIIVTGHSLGGPLATICCLDLWYFYNKLLVCFPFASPRVGNRIFANIFNKAIPRCYRYVNKGDTVCSLPTSFMGFKHVATKIKIGKWKWYHFFSKFVTSRKHSHYPSEYMKYL